jgi:hypothetical protein
MLTGSVDGATMYYADIPAPADGEFISFGSFQLTPIQINTPLSGTVFNTGTVTVSGTGYYRGLTASLISSTGGTLCTYYNATTTDTWSCTLTGLSPGTYTGTISQVSGGYSYTGNTVAFIVTTPDTTPPVVTLSGSSSLTIAYGSTYTDA